MDTKKILARRDFLKLALMAGGGVALAPFLKACSPVTTLAPTSAPGSAPAWTPTPAADLLKDLRGLEIEDFFQKAYRLWAARDPETLTTLGLADVYGVGDGVLTDISDEFIRETQTVEAGTLEILQGYDRAAFTDEQSVTADIYAWFLDDLIRGHPFMYADYPVNPMVTSVHYNLYMLFTAYHPLENIQDANDYVARLSQVGTKLAQLVDGLKRREERGVILPAFIIPYVTGDLDGIAYSTPSSNDYYTAFKKRLNGVADEERDALLTQVEEQVKGAVMPAYKELSDFLGSQKSKSSDDIGVWQFADGEAYYAQSLRRQTTTELSADEIHEIGKQHVERVQIEMRELFAKIGYSAAESIPNLYKRLTNESGVYRGQDAVAAYEEAIRGAEEMLPQMFNILPRAKVEVLGGEQGDYYMPAAFDGSRPGLFYARTSGGTPKFGVKSLAYHETIPGHHFQIALAQEVPNLPDLRRGMQFNAYAEGWALYAERLMWEMGVYADDPQGDLGRLRMEAYRAARLVVDTGIHAKKWNFDEAAKYLAEAAGFSDGYAQNEIVRYAVWPAQATSYYLGFLKLLELRQKAKDALGNKFDLKAFHQVVLANGSVPLTVLENLIDTHIKNGA
jgi:uncharacterized protein (DUF885 family)